MFEDLTGKLQQVFRSLTGKGRLSEADVAAACRELRLVLLEADVHFKVVKDFIARVKERSVGQDVMQSLTPGQQVIKIVNEEMTELLGGAADTGLRFAASPPTVIMLVGLQGSGKTTSAGKLAVHLRKIGHQPLLAATDTRRPAAIQQLQTAGEQLGIPVAEVKPGQSPLEIARAGVAQARAQGRDTVVLDTQGRLHIDDELMGELVEMQREVSPTEVLLVLDAMTGQDAVQSATAFDEKLAVTGLILSKLDGDSRGGAALSARAVTGKPIKFAGVGEKAEALEPFHPDRMASRILGMGDVLTLIEKAGTAFDEAEAAKLEKKLRQNRFDLEDFLQQMQQVSKMGPLDQILDMVPGVAALRRRGPVEVDTGRIARMQAIIQSMTPEERHSPDMIHSSRKRRIAAGSGTDVQSVNQLLSQFRQMKTLFSQMEGMHKSGRTPGLPTFFNR